MQLEQLTLYPNQRAAVEQLKQHPKAILAYDTAGLGAADVLMTALVERAAASPSGLTTVTFIGPRNLFASIGQTSARVPFDGALELETITSDRLVRDPDPSRLNIALNLGDVLGSQHDALAKALADADVAYVFAAPIVLATRLGQMLARLPQVKLGRPE